ncbi:hypothetical protein ACUXDX_002360 [Staphylococcus epidermidis]
MEYGSHYITMALVDISNHPLYKVLEIDTN